MKYYFITYQATNKQGTKSTWNQVINMSPMRFIKDVEKAEISGIYHGFVVLNTCEISKEEFEEFEGHF